jgi:hypothetical protein
LSQRLYPLRQERRVAPWFIIVVSLASAACDNEDQTSLRTAGSGGIGVGGSAGGPSGGVSGNGGIGNGGRANGGGGNGGNGGTDLDAGADAAGPPGPCVVGTLEAYCSVVDCPPALAGARTRLRSNNEAPYLRGILQRSCVAVNGAARIAVSAEYLDWSRTFVYDAATEQLVGVELINDVAGCEVSDPREPGWVELMGFYGEASPDCSPDVDFVLPDACLSDAGAPLDGGSVLDAGPYECVVAP